MEVIHQLAQTETALEVKHFKVLEAALAIALTVQEGARAITTTPLALDPALAPQSIQRALVHVVALSRPTTAFLHMRVPLQEVRLLDPVIAHLTTQTVQTVHALEQRVMLANNPPQHVIAEHAAARKSIRAKVQPVIVVPALEASPITMTRVAHVPIPTCCAS